MTTPPRDHSLLAMFGMSLALAALIMAMVPVFGPSMSGAGAWMCWKGRHSEFAQGARICLWVNVVACVVGIATSIWFIHSHWAVISG